MWGYVRVDGVIIVPLAMLNIGFLVAYHPRKFKTEKGLTRFYSSSNFLLGKSWKKEFGRPKKYWVGFDDTY